MERVQHGLGGGADGVALVAVVDLVAGRVEAADAAARWAGGSTRSPTVSARSSLVPWSTEYFVMEPPYVYHRR